MSALDLDALEAALLPYRHGGYELTLEGRALVEAPHA